MERKRDDVELMEANGLILCTIACDCAGPFDHFYHIEMLAPQSVHGICTFAAGGLAGAAANIITCPLDVIRINMQARANVGSEMQQIHTPLSMASKIIAEQGPHGLYRGLSLQLVRISG